MLMREKQCLVPVLEYTLYYIFFRDWKRKTLNEVTGLGGLISSSAVWDMLSVWEMSGDFHICATRTEGVSLTNRTLP